MGNFGRPCTQFRLTTLSSRGLSSIAFKCHRITQDARITNLTNLRQGKKAMKCPFPVPPMRPSMRDLIWKNVYVHMYQSCSEMPIKFGRSQYEYTMKDCLIDTRNCRHPCYNGQFRKFGSILYRLQFIRSP